MAGFMDWLKNLLSKEQSSIPSCYDSDSSGVGAAVVPRPDRKGPKRHIEEGDYRITLDLDPQVLGLSMIDELDCDPGADAQVVAPTLKVLAARPGHGEPIVSGAMMAQKAKQFDDGLIGAVELAAQQGAGAFRGKAALIRNLLPGLAGLEADSLHTVAPLLFGAADLGGLDPSIPESLRGKVKEEVDDFLGDPLRSKPMGIYTWSESLKRIFRQDRLLQEKLRDRASIEILARLLHADPESRTIYEEYLRLVSRLTNPLVPEKPDLRGLLSQLDKDALELEQGAYWFFPPSRSHETELMKALYGNEPIPEGFNLFDELIERIRDGRLSLFPREDSGWYDYQSWALESLVDLEKAPEGRRLAIDDGYKKHLEELFKGIQALTRESHVKQLEFAALGAALAPDFERPELTVRPELSVEPLHSYFLRRTIGYRFIEKALVDHFGAEGLEAMHRQTAAGPMKMNLAEELRHTASLFFGAFVVSGRELGFSDYDRLEGIYLTVCRYLGMGPDDMWNLGSGRGEDHDADVFLDWAGRGNDPDLAKDCRMMVPLFFDKDRGRTKVWIFLGWNRSAVSVHFARQPGYRVEDRTGRDATSEVDVRFETRNHDLARPVIEEVYVDRILDRDEFRAHCDRYGSRGSILENLE
jgi:hypothetical protein